MITSRHVLRALLLAAFAASPLIAQETVATEPWRLIQPPQSSLVVARDGSLIGEIGKEWRTSVSIKSLPNYVPQAFVAIEDHRFYEHGGVDVIGIAGAIKDAVTGSPRGASTITQQLVGNMHPEEIDRSDRSLSRKVREQRAAIEMEKRYTKDEILEAYLNQISFGHGWFGIEAAARHYFGKSASQLTLEEAATLAALPKGPAIYDPIRHPDRAKSRRNEVLSRMADNGFITKAVANVAKRKPLVVAPTMGMSAPSPYFVDVVRVRAERAGIPVMNGGYRVVTTLDPALQSAAMEALTEGTRRVEGLPAYGQPTYAKRARGSTDYLQGMVVSLDALTGEVRALVGGRDYAESSFNRAVNGVRQPGSAFKPIVYAAAITDSIPANAVVPDTALAIPLPDSTLYEPQIADNEFMGPITNREGLVRSRNPVAVQLGLLVGMDTVASFARRMGIESPVDPVPASAIGASSLRPIELVAAYSTFATLGVTVEPRFITRIEDRAGRTVWAPQPSPPKLAIDPRVAFIVRDMMRESVERGTGAWVRRLVDPRVPVAGKTGTTNDNTDVWFVGMTPELVAGVWLGFDRPRPIAQGAGGGTYAAPIFGQMIAKYYEGRAVGTWAPPAGLISAELDRETGMLADAFTPVERRYTEYFIEGTEPVELRPSPWLVFQYGPLGV
ncbi:MAG: PBP1A family penicillin-binding protein [Gemmatimonadota bacterium]|nr:PBP1A family penicillin-binding protein [Gemmatimonadota bacterium]